MELNLLEKTEIRISDIELKDANLTDLASVVSDVLHLCPSKVLVIDVRKNHIALDILQKTVKAEHIYGKKTVLLDALARLPGVMVKPTTEVHSDGVLGFIGLDEPEAARVIEQSNLITDSIISRKRGKVIVFPTGFELIEEKIVDTNTPYIVKKMEEAGYYVTRGEIIPDLFTEAVARLREAAYDYGIIITTGGVGAEDKDFTIESITNLDPGAFTPYIAKFHQGQGRHIKDGVRIAVGEYEGTLLIALPGPHDEVTAVIPVIMEGLKKKMSRANLAAAIAEILRQRLHVKMGHWKHH